MNANKWLVFFGAALAVMMVDIDVTAVNLAITDITRDLNLSLSNGQWIVNGYSMAAAVLMAFAGRLGDSFGHKRVFLVGVFVFSLSSLAVALSQGFLSIAISRIIQGACIAFTFPMASVFVREAFPDYQKGLAISLLISIAGISQAIGPTFGGAMIEFLSWHWMFLINIPLAIVAFIFISLFLKEPIPKQVFNLHLSSLLTMIIGLFALMTALNEVNQFGVQSWQFCGLILLGVISLSYTIHQELHSESPLLDLKLLMNSRFASLISIRFILNFVYFSWLFGLGILLQKGLGYSSFTAGVIMLCLTLTISILSAPVGKWIDASGINSPIRIGLLLMLASCMLMAWDTAMNHVIYMIISLFLAGVSASFLIPSTATGCFQVISPDKLGVAMGVLFTCGFLGNSFGVAISGSIMDEDTIMKGFSYAMILCSVLSVIALSISKVTTTPNESVR